MKFDKFSFDEESKDFETEVIYNNEPFGLTLCDFGQSEIDRATVLATGICSWLEKNFEEVRQFAASQLTRLKNDSWLEEDQQPINEASFAATIELDGIIAFSKGSFEIYFNDNDLFWGHLIRVDIDKDFKLSSAAIAG
jgi:hypothetical protein